MWSPPPYQQWCDLVFQRVKIPWVNLPLRLFWKSRVTGEEVGHMCEGEIREAWVDEFSTSNLLTEKLVMQKISFLFVVNKYLIQLTTVTSLRDFPVVWWRVMTNEELVRIARFVAMTISFWLAQPESRV